MKLFTPSFWGGFFDMMNVLAVVLCSLMLGAALSHRFKPAAPEPRPTTILLPQNPAVLVLVSPIDDKDITTDTLAGLHNAGLLAYRAAVSERLELIAKGRRP